MPAAADIAREDEEEEVVLMMMDLAMGLCFVVVVVVDVKAHKVARESAAQPRMMDSADTGSNEAIFHDTPASLL